MNQTGILYLQGATFHATRNAFADMENNLFVIYNSGMVKSLPLGGAFISFLKGFVMEAYKSGSHTRYDIKYHIVWITKYGHPVLEGSLAERVRELIRQICMRNDATIIKSHVSKDHIHILASTSPSMSIKTYRMMIFVLVLKRTYSLWLKMALALTGLLVR